MSIHRGRRPRLILTLLAGLFTYQVLAAIRYATLPDEIQVALGTHLQWILIVLSVTWAGLLGLGIIKVLGEQSVWKIRALWLIFVFISYSGLRLIVLSEADYDRQRLPMVLALLLICMAVGGAALVFGSFRRRSDNDGDKNL